MPALTSAEWFPAGAIPGVSTATARPIAGWRRKSDARSGKSSWNSTPGLSRRMPPLAAAALPWPETGAWIGERLPSVIDDRGLIRVLADVIEEYEGMAVDAADRALVHGDLGLHNLALDQADAVNGVFDYDGAAWADRHHDFRYLLFDVGREDILDAALRIYEPAVERSLDRNRIRLYNAACAIGYLAQGRRPARAEVVWTNVGWICSGRARHWQSWPARLGGRR
jgi:hypothetical protein